MPGTQRDLQQRKQDEESLGVLRGDRGLLGMEGDGHVGSSDVTALPNPSYARAENDSLAKSHTDGQLLGVVISHSTPQPQWEFEDTGLSSHKHCLS